MPRLDGRPECEVIGHDIGHHGRQHQEDEDPKAPIAMRPFPVGAIAGMSAGTVRIFVVVVVMVFHLIHGFPAMLIPFRAIPVRFCEPSLRIRPSQTERMLSLDSLHPLISEGGCLIVTG